MSSTSLPLPFHFLKNTKAYKRAKAIKSIKYSIMSSLSFKFRCMRVSRVLPLCQALWKSQSSEKKKTDTPRRASVPITCCIRTCLHKMPERRIVPCEDGFMFLSKLLYGCCSAAQDLLAGWGQRYIATSSSCCLPVLPMQSYSSWKRTVCLFTGTTWLPPAWS